jgi:hypothetical protein
VTRAHIGPDDLHLFASPLPNVLREITGIEPEPREDHVRLDQHTRVRSTQRLALSAIGSGFIVGFWPAELKPQAEFLYTAGRAQKMLEAASARGWETYPSPQLAFYTSPPERRLYMHPDLSATDYAQRWEREDGRWIGQYAPEDVRPVLWPWLKARGFVTNEDDPEFEAFLRILGQRPAHLRPGLRFRKRWQTTDATAKRKAREDVNAILRTAGDTGLPRS